MTTFAGHTIPPLFGGGDAIFIRGVGAPAIGDFLLGNAVVNAPAPAFNVGDMLYTVTFSNGGIASPVNVGDWINIGLVAGGSLGNWRRVATGTIADEFRIPSTAAGVAGMYYVQQVSIGVRSGAPTFLQSGPAFDGTGDVWELTSLPVGPNPNNTLVFGSYVRFSATNLAAASPSHTSPATLSEIGAYDVEPAIGGFRRYLWGGWGSVFQATSAVVPTASIPVIPVTLAPFSIDRRTEYFRFGIV